MLLAMYALQSAVLDALRDAKAAMQPKVVGATQKLGQSRKVYEALEGIAARVLKT